MTKAKEDAKPSIIKSKPVKGTASKRKMSATSSNTKRRVQLKSSSTKKRMVSAVQIIPVIHHVDNKLFTLYYILRVRNQLLTL